MQAPFLFYSFLFIIFFFYFPADLSAKIERLMPIVVNKLPHDQQAFTQGLAIENEQLYESTGLYGQSSLRKLDVLTGRVLQSYSLSSEIFAEGLAVFPHQIVQISWKEQRALVYDRLTFQLKQAFIYTGEGWGLCRDGNTVWMSNGTSILVQRDPETFAILKSLPVSMKGKPVIYLNDLECDGNDLYANIWSKDWIVRIDKNTGEVTGIIDASHLLSPQEKTLLKPGEVLNGIAFRPTTKTFFLTGKKWPWIFEVRLK